MDTELRSRIAQVQMLAANLFGVLAVTLLYLFASSQQSVTVQALAVFAAGAAYVSQLFGANAVALSSHVAEWLMWAAILVAVGCWVIGFATLANIV
jgi:hypothetical protein